MLSKHFVFGLVLTGTISIPMHAQEKAGPDDNKAPEGFTLLFNGKELTNWQGNIQINKRAKLSADEREKAQKASNDKVLPHWKAVDGILVNDGEGDNLSTVKDFGDFELHVDWMIEPKGDSGIYLRGIPQVQIWDSATLTGNLAKDKDKRSGGLWNNKKNNQPLKNADKKAGEWNRFHIVMKGDKVAVRAFLLCPLPTIRALRLARRLTQLGQLDHRQSDTADE
jgi:Domain of Unknown Function (DUF1080)